MSPKEYRFFTDWLAAECGAVIGAGVFVAGKMSQAGWSAEKAESSTPIEQTIAFCGILALVMISSMARMRLIDNRARQLIGQVESEG